MWKRKCRLSVCKMLWISESRSTLSVSLNKTSTYTGSCDSLINCNTVGFLRFSYLWDYITKRLTDEMTHCYSGLLILDKPLLFPQQGNLQQQKSCKAQLGTALNWTVTKNPNNKATLQFQLWSRVLLQWRYDAPDRLSSSYFQSIMVH